jgi:hypothetical protein
MPFFGVRSKRFFGTPVSTARKTISNESSPPLSGDTALRFIESG